MELFKRAPRIVSFFGARVIFGQELANIEVLRTLRERGSDVLCVVRNEPWPEIQIVKERLAANGLGYEPHFHIDIPRKGWRVKAYARNPFAFLVGNATLALTLRRRKATHVLASNTLHIANFILALATSKVRLIYHRVDMPLQHHWIWRLAWKYICTRTDHFVAASHFIEQGIVALGVDKKRVTTLYLPPPSRPTGESVVLPTSANAQNAIRFIYAGQISKSKGVDVLIDAFASIAERHRNAHLIIAAPLLPNWQGVNLGLELQTRVLDDSQLKDNIHFLGWVEDMIGLMRQCHVHVCPSVTDEPYGLVVVEAKCAGIPSIVFPSGGLKELVSHGTDGWVTRFKDANELSNALESYVRLSPECVSTQGGNAKQSLQNFNFETYGNAWCTICSVGPN